MRNGKRNTTPFCASSPPEMSIPLSIKVLQVQQSLHSSWSTVTTTANWYAFGKKPTMMESSPVLCNHLFWKYKISYDVIQRVTSVIHYSFCEIWFKVRYIKYTVTTRLLQTREEGISVYRMVEKAKEITSRSRQATGKMGSKMKEEIPNKKCIIEELRLDTTKKKISTFHYSLAHGISPDWGMEV